MVTELLNSIKKLPELGREVCSEFDDKACYVIGSMGPTGYLPSSNDPDLGQISLDKINEAFEAASRRLDSWKSRCTTYRN